MSRSDNLLVRAVGRAPLRVHTKLLVAVAGGAVLLVAVGVLGQRVLGHSNDRVRALGELQERAVAYSALQSDTSHVRTLLAENVDSDYYEVQFGRAGKPPTDRGAAGTGTDSAVVSSLKRLAAATSHESLGFEPPPKDERVLRRVRAASERLQPFMERLIRLDGEGATEAATERLRARALQRAIDLNQLALELANRTTAETDDLIAENATAYASSRNMFIGVSVGAIVLALLLGVLLAWSLIVPIQRIDTRLAAIASGDFTGRVDVPNRDELGALATNVNRMNDELQRLYRELEEASRHKSEFLANMSHELRTPLNAVLGFSQVLRANTYGELNEKQEEYVDDILASGRHLLALINDVLDLSKVEAGQVELERAPFSLRDVLERGAAMVRERATSDGIEVALTGLPDADTVTGDERRVRQVVFNLLSNAVKFTPPGGTVDVRAERVDGEVRVAVTDTGPGIASADHERIFEQFHQTEDGAMQGEGTGLGLALSRRLVELHGGRIWVDSAPGKGSTFVFTLPLGGATP